MSFSLELKRAALVTHRLARISFAQRGNCHTCLRPNVIASRRGFGTGHKGSGEDDSNSSESPASEHPRLPLRTPLFGRRKFLSPLERVSRLLPQESLGPEVWQLRDVTKEDGNEQPAESTQSGERVRSTNALNGDVHTHQEMESRQVDIQRHMEADRVPGDESFTPVDSVTSAESTDSGQDTHIHLPGERMLSYGEVVFSERRRKKQIVFRKMFTLEENGKLHSPWGWMPHSAIADRPSGSLLNTSLGIPILLRRPSLEEFIVNMKRGPAISYPKDCAAMLTMMDVNEGDCVLECGSGSGAMSLFLSRAVGSKGKVLSFEVRADHHRRAALNYKHWRRSWSLRRGEDWPDNVQFLKADLQTAAPLLAGWGFNTISLDMMNPHLVLPVVFPHMHQGAVCAVYLANLTQVVDLLEGIRCTGLLLRNERIIEVQYRDWLVAPSFDKDGRFNSRKAPTEESPKEEEEEEEESYVGGRGGGEEISSPGPRPFGSVPYIARPHPEQGGHSAFLVKLRKILK